VPTDGDFAIGQSFCRPLRDSANNALVIPNVRFIDAGHGYMGDLVGDDAKQVVFDGLRVQKHHFLFVVGHPFAKFFIWRPLNHNAPPHAVHFEAH